MHVDVSPCRPGCGGRRQELLPVHGASCAVVQVAAAASTTNVARCIRTTGITQSCSINQSSTDADNQAIVVEIATKRSGLTQNASQTAQIVQTAGSGANTACVLQTTTLEGSTVARRGMPVSVTLESHQSVSIAQDSSTGDNMVQKAVQPGTTWICGDADGDPLTQSQNLLSTANGTAAITQKQNFADSGPNMLLDIGQNENTPSASGANSARFSQTSDLSAEGFHAERAGHQIQSSASGGLKATVDQHSSGESHAFANQEETQTEHAQRSSSDTSLPPNTTQTQYGPVGCCTDQRGQPEQQLHHRSELNADPTTTGTEGSQSEQRGGRLQHHRKLHRESDDEHRRTKRAQNSSRGRTCMPRRTAPDRTARRRVRQKRQSTLFSEHRHRVSSVSAACAATEPGRSPWRACPEP